MARWSVRNGRPALSTSVRTGCEGACGGQSYGHAPDIDPLIQEVCHGALGWKGTVGKSNEGKASGKDGGWGSKKGKGKDMSPVCAN